MLNRTTFGDMSRSLRSPVAFASNGTPSQGVGLPVALLETLPEIHGEARYWGCLRSFPAIFPAQVYLEALTVISPRAVRPFARYQSCIKVHRGLGPLSRRIFLLARHGSHVYLMAIFQGVWAPFAP